MSRLLGITGASGHIGQATMHAALARGWQVVAIGRKPVAGAQSWRHADITTMPSEKLLDGLDAVLHFAANTHGNDTSPAAELVFARGLAEQAAAGGIPMVFASSQAAAVDAPSPYGRSKFAIEQAIAPLNALSIRPGLVIGGRAVGLFGLLVTLVRALPLLPDLRPRPLVQPIHVDDLAAVFLAACDRSDLAGQILAAAGTPVNLIDLLSGVARHRLRVRRPRLPLPLSWLRLVLRLGAPVLGSRLSPARLDSLVQLPPLDAQADLATLGVTLRPLVNALDRRGRGIRRLLIEGYSLTRAMTGAKPPATLLRRYVRLLYTLGHHEALPLPTSLLTRPTWLAALDTATNRQRGTAPAGLLWRMNLVLRLAESEPSLADRFLMMPNRSGRFFALSGLVRAGVRELQLRLVAPIARHHAKGLL